MMKTFLLGLAVAIVQAQAAFSAAPPASKSAAPGTPTAELRIDSGAIRGLAVGDKKDVHAYKGIPYAAPPVGERRWKPPQPALAWQGVRDCFEFAAACPQKIPALFGSFPEMAIRAPFSEDCLYLNVWAPAEHKSEKLPVLYWIHGGGFVMGAASQPLYDGEELARLGCIVVSINYRLGLFGFLAHPALSQESDAKVSGNYGLLDQIEGLRWVKRNIAAFGGDPERVTIFGESAGGISVLCLMVAPEAKGLFHGAVAQSATGMNLPALRDGHPGQVAAEEAGRRFVAACGVTASADAKQMRSLTSDALVQAAPAEAVSAPTLRLKPLSLRLGPIVDRHVIPDSPNLLFAAGRQQAVPLIVGNTKDEMSLFLLTSPMPADRNAYLAKLKDEFGDLAEPLAKAYPAENAKEIRSAVIQLTTDLSFVSESRLIARTHAAAGQKAFRYQFSHGTKRGLLQSLGAHHGAELAFLFQRAGGRDDEGEKRISRAMGRYWLNFAATGNPNGPDLPEWPAYRTDADEVLDFGDNVTVLQSPRNDQLDLIEKVLRAMANNETKKAQH
jgi:para-nitrobenzyl esterase